MTEEESFVTEHEEREDKDWVKVLLRNMRDVETFVTENKRKATTQRHEGECWQPRGHPVEGWELVDGHFIIDGYLTFVTVEEQIANMTEERKKELGIE
jgi:hypothetical protein